MKKYLPLVLVETYLLATLLFYFFGPINFQTHNTILFLIIMFLYHIAFIFGFCISINTCKINQLKIDRKFSSKFFYLAFFFAVLSILVTYQNLMLSSSIIPYNIFEEVSKGIFSPDHVYLDRMNEITLAHGESLVSRTSNIFSIFFAFSKLFFIFYFLYFWNDLNFFKKSLVLFYSFLFLAPGFASGTNSVIFIFFIFLILTLIILFYLAKVRFFRTKLILFGFISLIPVGNFGYIMSRRGGGFEYFSRTSPLGDISVENLTSNLSSFLDFYYYAFVWLNYYIVQGYYGFSLIINLDLNWTFGFGNSDFLQRQFLLITGIDLSGSTFQSRISDYWSSAQWHSFYGQFANDFGLIGLSILLFILGYFFAKVWGSVIYNKSFYGASLLPIFALMFIFFPANNQVFGYIDTLSYFLFMTIFWFFEDKKFRFS